MGVGAAGAGIALEAANDNSKTDRSMTDPLPPNSPFPANDNHRPDHEEFPAKTPSLPDVTATPIENERKGWIEILPDQRDEISLPTIIERKGDEPVRAQNSQIRGLGEAYADRFRISAVHSGGARDRFGKEIPETYLKNYETGGRRGSSYADITFTSKKTGRRLLVNTVDTLVDGITPSSRERKAGIKLYYNAESGDIVVLIGKLRPGEQLDEEEFEKFLRPLLEEIDRPAPERDHRSNQSPQDEIPVYRQSN